MATYQVYEMDLDIVGGLSKDGNSKNLATFLSPVSFTGQMQQRRGRGYPGRGMPHGLPVINGSQNFRG